MQKIKVPDSLSDMNISHLPFFFAIGRMHSDKESIEDLRPDEVSDLNALFFGYELEYFDKFTAASNLELLISIIEATGKRKKEDIRPFIEVDGKKYIWQSDYSKQPVSFHRDVARLNIEEKPADLLAFCYVEEGMYFNQIDKVSKVILNERHARAEALKPHFNLAQYLDVHAFFLESLPVLRLSYLQSQQSKAISQLRKGKLFRSSGKIR
jgi:hypothetical protein